VLRADSYIQIPTNPSQNEPLLSFREEGLSFYKICRPSNLNGWTCDNGSFVYVYKNFCEEKNIKLFKKGDILISRIGDVKTGIIEGKKEMAISPNLIALRVDKQLFDPYYLLAFLNTEAGGGQIRQGQKSASIASVAVRYITNLKAPIAPLDEQRKIGNMVRKGLADQRRARKIYSQAEDLLNKEICLNQVDLISKEKEQTEIVFNNIVDLKAAKRADAEYFIEKKRVIKNKIKTVEIKKIGTLLRGVDPGREEYKKGGNLFLRVSNITKYGLLNKSQKFIEAELFIKLSKKFQPQVGEILLVKDGKPGTACMVNKPIEGIISDGIARIKIKKYNNNGVLPEYLCICINSEFCQEQIRADIDGTLVPHWKAARIGELLIPIAGKNIQKEIAGLMKKSNFFFQKSENKLELARNLIEKLINEGRIMKS
jgi:restriction endonuclease S subunit